MTFPPRFLVVWFYAAGWLFIIALYLAGVPLFLPALMVLIQLVNIASVRVIPVRVSIKAGHVECYFPFLATTKRFNLAETECGAHLNPIRMISSGDLLALRSHDSKAVIWRIGVKDFDRLCDELKITRA